MKFYKYDWTLEKTIVAENTVKNSAENPEEIAEFLRNCGILHRPVEQVWALHLNAKRKVIGYEVISIGTVNYAYCNPADFFRGAILNGACSVIIAHNHPSGDATPSGDDFSLTARLKECGKLLGIPLTDSIIITDTDYFSCAKDGIL